MIEPERGNALHADTPDSEETGLLDLLQVIVDHLWLLLLLPLVAGAIAFGASYFIKPTFTASTKFLPPQQQQSATAAMLQSLGSLGGLAGTATGLKNPVDQYVAFLKSRSIQNALIERYKLTQRYDAEFLQDTRESMNQMTRINTSKDGMIVLEVDDHDPAFAAGLANAYVEELASMISRLALTEAQQRRVFFEKQLHTAKDNLAKAEEALKSSGVNRNVLKISPTAAVEGIAQLQAAITAQEVSLSSMRSYLTENAPEFKQAQNRLAALKAQLKKSEREDAPSSINGNDGDYIAKFRNVKYFETLFDLFAKQYELARIDESREGAVIQVIDIAQIPEKKSKPKKALIAISVALATFFLLLIFIFIRSSLRQVGSDAATSEKFAKLRQSWRRVTWRN